MVLMVTIEMIFGGAFLDGDKEKAVICPGFYGQVFQALQALIK